MDSWEGGKKGKIKTKLKAELRVYQLTGCVILPGFKF